MEKKASKVIEGEKLDLLIGNRPVEEVIEELTSSDPLTADIEDKKAEKAQAKEAIKANVLRILKEKYDIDEEDFLSA